MRKIPSKHIYFILSLFLAFFGEIAGWAQSVTLSWAASSSPSVTGYEIFYGTSSGDYSMVMDAGNATTGTVTGLTAGTTYYFAVSAYSTSGSTESESPYSNETSAYIAAAPVILTEPLSQNVNSGGTAVFSVGASSALALTYQWYLNGIPVSGGTNSTLTVSPVTDANTGNYTVAVNNSSGSVTSSAAVLTTVDPPAITSQPAAQSAPVGSTVSFHVAVSGTAPFTFQWYTLGGHPIPTATKATLRLVNVTASNANSYFVVVQNAAGQARSSYAALTIVAGAAANPFGTLAGTYNGLFYQTNGAQTAVAQATAGMLGNCVVTTNGAFSARLYIAGGYYPLSGAFDGSGNANVTISRAGNSLPNLLVALSLDMTGKSEMITGSISNMTPTNPWVAPLIADLATNTLPVPAETFQMIVPPILNPLNVLTGDGAITVTTTGNGTVTLSGTLDDLTSVSQTVPVSNVGTIPFYCSLYGGRGLVEGWVNLANAAASGTITWIRPPGITNGLLFPLGFTNILSVN